MKSLKFLVVLGMVLTSCLLSSAQTLDTITAAGPNAELPTVATGGQRTFYVAGYHHLWYCPVYPDPNESARERIDARYLTACADADAAYNRKMDAINTLGLTGDEADQQRQAASDTCYQDKAEAARIRDAEIADLGYAECPSNFCDAHPEFFIGVGLPCQIFALDFGNDGLCLDLVLCEPWHNYHGRRWHDSWDYHHPIAYRDVRNNYARRTDRRDSHQTAVERDRTRSRSTDNRSTDHRDPRGTSDNRTHDQRTADSHSNSHRGDRKTDDHRDNTRRHNPFDHTNGSTSHDSRKSDSHGSDGRSKGSSGHSGGSDRSNSGSGRGGHDDHNHSHGR